MGLPPFLGARGSVPHVQLDLKAFSWRGDTNKQSHHGGRYRETEKNVLFFFEDCKGICTVVTRPSDSEPLEKKRTHK